MPAQTLETAVPPPRAPGPCARTQEIDLPRLDPHLAQQFRDIGGKLPELWSNGQLQPDQQKELLRALIRRVILTRPQPESLEIAIVWISGAVTRLTVHPTVGRSTNLADYDRVVARVEQLVLEGHSNREIARRLAAEGFRSARHTPLAVRLVQTIRYERGLPSAWQQARGLDQVDGCWTVPGLARALGISRHRIYDLIHAGTIRARQQPSTGRFLIADDPMLLDNVRAQFKAHRLT